MANVGADIESICRKCGDVWHVVVAKVGERIAKVQCKQCGGLHRYSPPGGTPAPIRRTRAANPTRPRGLVSSKQPLVQVDGTKPLRPYSMAESYAVGDRLLHATFGEGVIELLPGPHKAQVFFPSGRKVLAHGRSDL